MNLAEQLKEKVVWLKEVDTATLVQFLKNAVKEEYMAMQKLRQG